MRRAAAFGTAILVLLAAVACGGSPPQIVDYSPERGAKDVSTATPIQITFDHDVDQASVASRLHLVPDTQGKIRWASSRKLVYEHPTLRTATSYDVVLEAGYRDPAGNVYALRHHWSFTTELPPALATSSPADGATDIDPADYVSIDFTRPMDATSLRSAITFSPSAPFSVRLAPTDARRAIVAPDSLLDPNTSYQLMLNTGATDFDGNQLGRVTTIGFKTGAVRPLHHWVAFAAQGVGGATGGLWIVNPDSSFPRRLLRVASVQSFSWSPEGDRLVLNTGSGEWITYTPGKGTQTLNFQASWAAALAASLGYVYLQADGSLHRLTADGVSSVIATGVASAAVSQDGRRVAFADAEGGGASIWGYDVGLKSRYLLTTDAGDVRSITWAPDGVRLAYMLVDAKGTALRMRSLTGGASTTTVATGAIGPAVWFRDSDHVVFAATLQTSSGPITKAFLVNVVAPPATLTAGLGLPADPAVEVSNPVPSPDGHQIAFISGNQIWIMNADGTRPAPLTRFDPDSFPYSCRIPIWTRS